jgi:hypothetical protein
MLHDQDKNSSAASSPRIQASYDLHGHRVDLFQLYQAMANLGGLRQLQTEAPAQQRHIWQVVMTELDLPAAEEVGDEMHPSALLIQLQSLYERLLVPYEEM